MPELAERPMPQEEQSDLNAEQPTHDELKRTADQLSPQSDFETLIANKQKEFENLSDSEINAKIIGIIQEHGKIRQEIQVIGKQLDDLSTRAYGFAVSNLRGEGSVTLATRDTARRFLSQLNQLGQKMADLNQASQSRHEEGGASEVASGQSPSQESLTFNDILEAEPLSSNVRDIKVLLAKQGIDGSALAFEHPAILQERGLTLDSEVKKVAKYKIHPESHTAQSLMGFVGGAKNKLEELLRK